VVKLADTASAHGYRADVDGLRAVAVLAVVLWHFGAPGIGSGYVGVDVFFVISGFVITGLLRRQAEAGELSILGFYERRVRRIAPALLVMLAAVLAAAVVIQWPARLMATAKAALGAISLTANLMLAGQGGYFDQPSARQPLLHTWSLSVEEQFYLVYPLLFALVWAKARRWLTPLLLALFALSLAAAWLQPPVRREEAYFLAQARVWELMLGALVGLHGRRWRGGRMQRELMAISGVVLVAAGCAWPGVSALQAGLAASGGAALLILSGAETTLVQRALAWRPAVFVGLISYSLYLWHWPLFVFTSELMPRGVPWGARLVLLAACFALAVLSWRFIERPFRRPPRSARARAARLVIIGAAALAVAGAAAAAIAGGGWPGRFPPRTGRLVSYLDYAHSALWRRQFLPSCFAGRSADRGPAVCNPTPGRRSVLLWGDSHARDLSEPLAEAARDAGATFLQATHGACPPLLGEPRAAGTGDCDAFNRAVAARITVAPPEVVVLSFDGEYRRPRLSQTLAMLHRAGAAVIVVGPSPQFVAALPDLLARAPAPMTRAMPADVKPIPFAVDADLAAEAAAAPGVRYVSLISLLCPDRRCLTLVAPEVPLMWDDNHFGLAAARYVTRAAIAGPLIQALSAAPRPTANPRTATPGVRAGP
jgi:peptidoglycan/LPS O-acetylase OafA/YrhL